MRRNAIAKIVVTSMLLGTQAACGSAGFEGTTERIGAPAAPITERRDGTPDLGQEAGEGVAASCLSRARAVPRLMILLDVSSSMESSLALVRTRIAAVASQLGKGARLGLVAYAEGPSRRQVVPLTTDTAAFQAALAKIVIRDDEQNLDGPEEGLLAARAAVDLLAAEPGAGMATSTLLVVTDNFAHAGWAAPGTRTYDTTELVEALRGARLGGFQLYDAAPATFPDNSGLAPVNTPRSPPAAQWEAVRTGARAGGRGLGFPLTDAAFAAELPQDILSAVGECDGGES